MIRTAPAPSLSGWVAENGREPGPLPQNVPRWWLRSWLRLYTGGIERTCGLGVELDVARHQRGPDATPDPAVNPRWYLTSE